MVDRKRGYAVMAKVFNKTYQLISSAIVDKFQLLSARVKILTFDYGRELVGHAYIDEQLQRLTTLLDQVQAGNWAVMKTSPGCFANTFQRNEPCPGSLMRALE